MSDPLPEYLTAAKLVKRGFLPSDAEKVEAFARRLLDKSTYDDAVAVLESSPKTKDAP
jgi:hypothetical protein